MKSASDLPVIAEPWFLALNATISVKPAMTPHDLGAEAGAAIQAAVKAYPKTLGS